MKRKLSTLIIATAFVAPLSLLGISPAAAATAPSCVKVVKTTWKDHGITKPAVQVTNRCKTTQRVKVIWAWGFDGSCHSYKPNYTYNDGSGKGAKFDELRKC